MMSSRPKTRKEFERNMHFLREAFFKNTIKINASMHRTIRGIKNTQALPNNRANLLSVDQSSRLQSNTMANFSMFKNEK